MLQRHRKPPINHTSCLTSRSGTPALGLTARAPASGTFAIMHLHELEGNWHGITHGAMCSDAQRRASEGIFMRCGVLREMEADLTLTAASAPTPLV